MKKEEEDKKLLKGICPKCGKDLEYDTEYELIYCNNCNFKISQRDMPKK